MHLPEHAAQFRDACSFDLPKLLDAPLTDSSASTDNTEMLMPNVGRLTAQHHTAISFCGILPKIDGAVALLSNKHISVSVKVQHSSFPLHASSPKHDGFESIQ